MMQEPSRLGGPGENSSTEIQLWDMNTRQPVGAPLTAPGTWVGDIEFAKSDTSLVAYTSTDTSAVITALDVSYLTDAKAIVCREVGQLLTPTWWAANVPAVNSNDMADSACTGH